MTPFNQALHDHLTGLGYLHHREEDSWEDIGDGESGPCLVGGPAFDMYTGPDDYVYCDENGHTGHEPRDLALEAFCNSMVETSQ